MPAPKTQPKGLTRRTFTTTAAAAGAAVAVGCPNRDGASAQASTATLYLYIALWRSEGELIDWASLNPKTIAEQFCFLVWAYIRSFDFESLFLGRDKGSVIGHAALLASLRISDREPELLAFSNTGGDVGLLCTS